MANRIRWIGSAPLLVLCGLALVGCPGGARPAPVEGPDLGPAHDLALLPDGGPPQQDASPVAADGCPPTDSAAPVADAATSADSATQPQGLSCGGSGVQLQVSPALQACASVTVIAEAQPAYAWVMTGVGGPGAMVTWQGQVQVADRPGGGHRWTFHNVSVPCSPGPYSLHFMKDATNNNAALGVVVVSCVP